MKEFLKEILGKKKKKKIDVERVREILKEIEGEIGEGR